MPRNWFDVKAAGEGGGSAEIYIYDYIGKSWYNDRAMSATKLIDKLKDLKGQHVDVHINSLGGDAFEGQAIHNALRRHEGGTTAYIDGIAYSAATHVALGCDEVVIADNALFGIHKAWSWCVGNCDEMEAMCQALQKVDHTQVVVYERKTSLPRAGILATMTEDIPMTAEEATEAGYCDRIGDEVEAEALARSPLDIAAHRIPDRFAAVLSERGAVVPQASIDDDDIKDKLESARDMARAVADTIEDCLEEDEAGTDAEASAGEHRCPGCLKSTVSGAGAPDTPRKVGAEVADLLLS